jgi:hypothetical protein
MWCSGVVPFSTRIVAVVIVTATLLAAACGGDNDAARTPDAAASYSVPTPDLATAVTTASAGRTATLDAETFVSDRTLPPATLSAERLEDAGAATTGDGTTPMARATSGDVAPWELVSPDADGWLVWRPKVVLDILADAGMAATLVKVESVNWPDACIGIDEPDVACAQVITPGYLVEVTQGGETIEYHASRAGRFRQVAAERN